VKEVTDNVTVEDIAKDITTYASRHGEDAQVTWDKWLAWMCEGLDAKYVVKQGIHEALSRMRDDNMDFFTIMRKWFVVANHNMRRESGFDAFGTIYEAAFKSKYKASGCGQFFTPVHICTLMARICGESKGDEYGIVRYNDCAVGSGRTLLAAWNAADKYGKNFFDAGDIDPTSVRMCALNFMMNGMVGCVSLQDAMSLEWRFGYIVNACKVPCANDTACVEYFNDQDEFIKRREQLIYMMRFWDVGEYRPNNKNETEEKDESEGQQEQQAAEEPKGEVVQAELF